MNSENTQIVILGATGSIGSKLSALFICEGYVVHCIGQNNDLSKLDLAPMETLFINCAFNFSGSLEENKKLVEDIFHFVSFKKVARFINMSTIDSYSNPAKGFSLNAKPDTKYGIIKRELDSFIDEKFGQITNLNFLILGAINDNGSGWSRLINITYVKDKKYGKEAIPLISVDEIYEAINEINDQSPLYIMPKHNWLYLRDLWFMNDKVLFSALLRFILRNNFTATIQKVLRKLKLGKTVQADLVLFERLASRSKNFKS